MKLVLGTTTRALAEQEALRRELTPGPNRPPSFYTHLLSPEREGRPEDAAVRYRALGLGVLTPPGRTPNRRR